MGHRREQKARRGDQKGLRKGESLYDSPSSKKETKACQRRGGGEGKKGVPPGEGEIIKLKRWEMQTKEVVGREEIRKRANRKKKGAVVGGIREEGS